MQERASEIHGSPVVFERPPAFPECKERLTAGRQVHARKLLITTRFHVKGGSQTVKDNLT
jgi:hypothetical protein